MNFSFRTNPTRPVTAQPGGNRLFAVAALSLLTMGSTAHGAITLARGGGSTSPGTAGTSSTQTTTVATTTTAQASQTAAMAQLAQVSLKRSTEALQAFQAQQNAQSAARNLALTSTINNLGTSTHPLIDVPDGLVVNGLVPGVAGTDAANPATTATSLPVTVNANGTASVTLAAHTAITLPPSATASSQITVSGTGVVGTITTGATIASITAGTPITAPPGSTISLTTAGTISFASASAIPTAFASYALPASWSGISGLTQSTYSPGTGQTGKPITVTLTQTQQQALLTWQTFNIGRNTTLDFDQSAGGSNVANWVAINQVAANIAPTQILGSIQAPGQVYVINQNGVIFGGSSQVNTGALVASSLALNPAYITNGVLSDSENDYQFQFSSLFTVTNQGSGSIVAPLWTAPPTTQATVSSVPTGDVTVQAGAQLSTSTNGLGTGGLIALIGPNVTNDGTISTPDGQTILAAGLQVGLAAHSANDPSLRGLDVYIGQVTAASSTLSSGTFTFNGLPNNDQLTFSGTGQVGTYSTPGSTTPIPLPANTPVTIPVGSTVKLTSGTESFAAVAAGAAGTVTNNGLIGTLRSGVAAPTPGTDLTMAGQNVNQLGDVDLSTSVTLNSRVDLLADYGAQIFNATTGSSAVSGFYPTETGTTTLGPGSVTELTPDLSSTATVVGTQLALPSLVNIQGLDIDMDSNALLYAPSANLPSNASQPAQGLSGLTLTAGVTLNAGQWSFVSNAAAFSNSNGQVSVQSGAAIDASGSENVNASVSEDVVAVQLTAAALENSPLQQNGVLHDQTIYVDLRDIGVYNGTPWIGTPLADASGYVDLIQRSVGELTTAGGTVAINAGGAVDMQSGSTVNVSGGWINYQGATVHTTNLVSNGEIINISKATPNLVYSGIYNGFTAAQPKYGLSETYTNPSLDGMQYDPGYLQGGSGGSLTISAPSMLLSGNLYGNTIAGTEQRTPAGTYTQASSAYAETSFLPTILATLTVPKPSSLSLNFAGQNLSGASVDPATPQNVDFGSTGPSGDLLLSTQITSGGGFGALTINDYTGNINLPADTPLTLPAGGSLTLTAANIDLESNITIPDGTLNFKALEVSPYDTGLDSLTIAPPDANSPPGAVSLNGNFVLGASVSLEAGGLAVDDGAFSSQADELPLLTSGGSISINGYSVFLRSNSQIDASGGVHISNSGAISYGAGGTISIVAGLSPNNSTSTGKLFLGSTLSAYSGLVGGGGSLTIEAPLVQIGGTMQAGLQNGDSNAGVVQEGTSVYGNGNSLWLDPSGTPEFFSQGGFENFTIKGIGEEQLDSSGNQAIDPVTGNPLFDPAVLIAPGTVINPVVASSTLVSNDVLVPMTLAEESQLLPSERSPVNLSFAAAGLTNNLTSPPVLLVQGDIVMGLGSSITTEAQDLSSSNGVAFSAPNGTITLLGSVIAPGGTISVSGATNSTTILFADTTDALPTVELGSQSLLSTAGVVEYSLNTEGYTTGSVLNGGKISLKGNIVAEAGSTMDVSGSSAILDVNPAQAGANPSTSLSSPAEIPVVEASNAGSITLSGSQELFSDATLLGNAGGPSAQGGSLSVSAGAVTLLSPLDATLVVTQSGPTFVDTPDAPLIGTVVTATNQLYLNTSSSGSITVGSTTGSSSSPIEGYFAADPNIFASKTVSGDTGNGSQAGGFQTLTLGGTVDFSGPVTITTGNSISVGASSSTEAGGVIYADNSVVLQAPYVALGLPLSLPTYNNIFAQQFNPSYGPGTLTVNASTVADVGNLSLQNIGTVNFNTTLANVPVAVVQNSPITITGNGVITSTSGGTITSANGTTTQLVAGVATSVTSGSSLTLSSNGTITPAAAGIIPARIAGDIQGDGTFDVQGNISMTAAQLYPPTDSFFSIFAYDYNNVVGDSSVIFTQPLQSETLPSLPLSAGGTLNVYASTITQYGVLRAPQGSINLGVGVASSTPIDYFTGSGEGGQISTTALPVPTTGNLTLGSGSLTSVSLIEPNGQALIVPYGIINTSNDWIDPAGNDITSAGNGTNGLPAKSVNLSGQTITDQSGATIDLRGGGDLLAYQFVSGTGGTNDILASNSSFAVIPSYSLNYAPFAPYAVSSSLQTNGVADAGYANPNLTVGEQVYLNSSSGLPAGVYTLLPARYALLPGAYLVTPSTSSALAPTATQANGISYVSGYRFDGLSNSSTAAPLSTEFEVESQSVVLSQADYQRSYANTYFPKTSATNNQAVPLLPRDAGQLVIVAGELSLPTTTGSLLDSPGSGGLGGEVDIAGPEPINIDNANDPGTVDSTAGVLNLDSTELTDFGAASLLIGGYRTTGSSNTTLSAIGSAVVVPSSGGMITFPQGTPGNDTITIAGTGTVGTYTSPGGATTSITGGSPTTIPAGSILTLAEGGTVTFSRGTGGPIPVDVSVQGTGVSVTSSQITVNNAGATLSGADIILVSNGTLIVDPGSTITAATSTPSVTTPLALVGDGSLLRVSSDSSAQISRTSVHAASGNDPANLEILSSSNAATTISGAGVILDSTNQTTLGANVNLGGTSVALDSGQISLEITTPAIAPSTTGLILGGQELTHLQANAQSLSLLSYSSIDIYNDDLTTPGLIGGAPVNGVYPVGSLALHATDIRGFGGGDDVISAQSVTLDNSSGAPALGAAPGINSLAGTLTVDAQTIYLGTNSLQVDQFANVNLNAGSEMVLTGLGAQGAADTTPTASAFNVAGALNINTPLITGAVSTSTSSSAYTTFVDEAISAQGAVVISNPNGAAISSPDNGLGAELQLTGSSVSDTSNIVLHSGSITLAATGTASGSDVSIGTAGNVDVSGLAPNINNLTKYTDGGNVTLSSAHGNVNVSGAINVSAQSGQGTADSVAANAGSLTVKAQNGTFTPGGTINGQAGVVTSGNGTVLSQGNGGSFALDVGSLPSGILDAMEAVLTPSAASGPVAGDTYVGGFTQSQSIRVRSGSIVVDGVVAAQTVDLTADNGDIEVTSTGRIDATAPVNGLIDTTTVTQMENGAPVTTLTNPGATGGTIMLAAGVTNPGTVDPTSGIAWGSVVLDSGSLLSVAGQGFNDAGRGGSVTLQAGSDLQGSAPSTATGRLSNGSYGSGVAVVNVQTGSTIDLSVKYLPIQLNTSGSSSLTLATPGAIYFPQGTPGNDQISVSGTGVVGSLVSASGVSTPLNGGTLVSLPAGSTLNLTNSGSVITFAQNGTGGAITLDLPSTANFTSSGASNLSGNAALTAANQGDLTGTLVLQAPQTSNNSDVQVDPIDGTVIQASSIVVGGLYVQNAATGSPNSVVSLDGSTAPGGTPTDVNYETLAMNNAANFALGSISVTVNPNADTSLTLTGTPLEVLAGTGTTITFPQGTPGNDAIIVSGQGVVGSYTTPGGTTISITGGTPTSIPAGSALQLPNGGSISLAQGGAGIPITVAGTFNETLAPTGGSLVVPDAGGTIDFAQGTSSNSGIIVSGTGEVGTYTTPSGNTVSITGGVATLGIPAGSVVSLNAGGTVTFTSTGATSYQAMANALVGANSQGVSGLVQIEPVEEIDNTSGSLVLNNSWDFSQNRFGPQSNLPGILILRSAGDLSVAFGASLSDGFDLSNTGGGVNAYSAPLLQGQASWSFNLIAGADLSSANINQVNQGAGSFILGQDAPPVPSAPNSINNPVTTNIVLTQDNGGYYQTVRTGTGNISITAGGDVQIVNELATIYTAGTAVSNTTGFDEPFLPITQDQPYPAQYSTEGGDVTLSAIGNIGLYTATGDPSSSSELPTSWLYRQGATSNGLFSANSGAQSSIESTSWWVNFSNFFEGVGALGGGNVKLEAGESVVNIDASIPTNAQMPATDASGNPLAPNAANLVELGGGDLTVQAGVNIDAGVYYVEKGEGTLTAGNEIVTNSTRATLTTTQSGSSVTDPDPFSFLPITLFAGDASFNVSTNGNLLLGPVANPFLLPQNLDNGANNQSYFSTYNTSDAVNASSLSGSVTIQDNTDTSANTPSDGSLYAWYSNLYFNGNNITDAASSQPWLQILQSSLTSLDNAFYLMPPTLRATAYSGNIDLVGSVLLSPSPNGTVDLLAEGSVNGFQPKEVSSSLAEWGSSLINLSDANPANIPGVASPLSATSTSRTQTTNLSNELSTFNALFNESGATVGLTAQQQESLHADINNVPLHANDSNPVYIYAATGDISGLNLFSGKFSDVVAGRDIQDIALYIQNDEPGQISVVDAGRNLAAYDPNSLLRTEAQSTGNSLLGAVQGGLPYQDTGSPNAGDIQISGPGTLEVLAGGSITLGDGPVNTSGDNGTSDGTDTGVTSVGNLRNPVLSSIGADIVVGAGIGGLADNLSGTASSLIGFTKFEDEFLNPDPADPTLDPDGTQAKRYLPDLGTLLGLDNATTSQVWTAFQQLSAGQQDALALQVYYLVLRDAGRDHNTSTAAGASTYAAANEAIAALFPAASYSGNISLSSREIATESGGNVELFAPGGELDLGTDLTKPAVDQGILTEAGGNVAIFTNNDVTIGTSRIFTLDGGNIVIYSANGSIDAGAASKTVQSAPPTRVLINPQSGAVQTDLAGLATGGGIGVLESQAGAKAGDVDLVAPKGVINAGDAGIRVSGNLNIAAVQVLNAGNISVGGKSAGVPTTTSPNLAGLSAASNAAGAGANEAGNVARQQQQQTGGDQSGELPSIITVEVLGYGGGDGDGA